MLSAPLPDLPSVTGQKHFCCLIDMKPCILQKTCQHPLSPALCEPAMSKASFLTWDSTWLSVCCKLILAFRSLSLVSEVVRISSFESVLELQPVENRKIWKVSDSRTSVDLLLNFHHEIQHYLHASCMHACRNFLTMVHCLQQLLDTLDVLAPTCAVLATYTQTTLTPCKDLSVDDTPCAAVQNGAPCNPGCMDVLNQVGIPPARLVAIHAVALLNSCCIVHSTAIL